MKLNKLVAALSLSFVSGLVMANDGNQTTMYVPNTVGTGYELNGAQSTQEGQARDVDDAIAVTWGEIPVSATDLGSATDGIERQLSLPVNDNYNCRLNHPNLAWFSLQLQY